MKLDRWLSMPKLAVLAAMLSMYMNQPSIEEMLVRTHEEHGQRKYDDPEVEIWVDTPLNTLGTDQSVGAGLGVTPPISVAMVGNHVNDHFINDTLMSPGLQLVGHAVA